SSSGDICTDFNGVSGSDLEPLRAGRALPLGSVVLSLYQDCGDDYFCSLSVPPLYDESGSAYFITAGPDAFGLPIQFGLPSAGSCQLLKSGFTPGTTPVPLDAGPVLNLSGPKGTMQLKPESPGSYFQRFSSLVPQPQYLQPGDYTIDNGAGG